MKMIVAVVLAFVAISYAAAASVGPEGFNFIPIVRSNSVNQPNGSYQFDFESGNGLSRNEVGELKEVFDEEKKPHDVVVVRGTFSYTNPEDGTVETVNYYADETGYHADGPSIPKAVSRR